MSGELTITAFAPNELFTCSSHLRQQPQPASRNITGFAACAVPMMAEKAARVKHARRTGVIAKPFRSEEHTSELQSLMSKSYDDFCLKNKTKQEIRSNDKN